MNMYIWNDHYSFLAVAHAESVVEARAMLLEDFGTTDGSCTVRTHAREVIQANNPTIFRGKNCEFAFDEGEGAHFS